MLDGYPLFSEQICAYVVEKGQEPVERMWIKLLLSDVYDCGLAMPGRMGEEGHEDVSEEKNSPKGLTS
jgi:hypothetical protein